MFNWFKKKNWDDKDYQICRDYTYHQVFQCPGFLDKPTVCEIKPDFNIMSDYFRGEMAFIQDDIYAQIAYNNRPGHDKIIDRLGKILSKGLTPMPDAPVYLPFFFGNFFPMVYKIDTSKPFEGPLAEALPIPSLRFLDQAYCNLAQKHGCGSNFKAYEIFVDEDEDSIRGKKTADKAIADLISAGVIIPTDLTPYLPIQVFDEYVPVSMDIIVPDFITKRKMKGQNQGATREELKSLGLPYFIDPSWGLDLRFINKNFRLLNRIWVDEIPSQYYSIGNRPSGLRLDEPDPSFKAEVLSPDMAFTVRSIKRAFEEKHVTDTTLENNSKIIKAIDKFFMSKNFVIFAGDNVQPTKKRLFNVLNKTLWGIIAPKHKDLNENKMFKWLQSPEATDSKTIMDKLKSHIETNMQDNFYCLKDPIIRKETLEKRMLYYQKKDNVYYPEDPVYTMYKIEDMTQPSQVLPRTMYSCFCSLQGFKNRFIFSREVLEKKETFRQSRWLNKEETVYNFLYTDIRTLFNMSSICNSQESKARMLNIIHAPEVAPYRGKMLETGIIPEEPILETGFPVDKCPWDKDFNRIRNPRQNMVIPSVHIPIYELAALVPENMPMWQLFAPLQGPTIRSLYANAEGFSAQTGLMLAMKRHGLDNCKYERFKDAYFLPPVMETGAIAYNKGHRHEDEIMWMDSYDELGYAEELLKIINRDTEGVGVNITKGEKEYVYGTNYLSYSDFLNKFFNGDEERLVKGVKKTMDLAQEIAVKGKALAGFLGKDWDNKRIEEVRKTEQQLELEQAEQRRKEEAARLAEEKRLATIKAEREATEKKEQERLATQEAIREAEKEKEAKLRQELGGIDTNIFNL